MASKLKTTQLKRKEQYERRLKTRLALLSERKTDPSKINKDPLVKNLRANIEATDARLKAIAKIEQRTAELAKIKAEKAEAAKGKRRPLSASLRKAARRKARRRARTSKDKETKEGPGGRQGKKGKRRKKQRLTPRSRLRWNKEAVLLERAAFCFRGNGFAGTEHPGGVNGSRGEAFHTVNPPGAMKGRGGAVQ